jgi:PAS domain S-box-containing protein
MFHRVPEKMSMILLLMILIFSGCSILYISVITTNALKEQARDDIRAISTFSARQVNGDDIARLQPGDESQPSYLVARDQLSRLKQSMPDIRSIYVLKKTGDKVEIVIDGQYGISPGGRPIGTPYIPVNPELLEGFFTPSVDREFSTDPAGTFLTGYSPIMTTKGEVAGIIAVDVGKDTVIIKQNLINWTSYMIVFLAILMAVFGVLGVEQVRSRLMKDLKDREVRYHALFEETYDAILIMVDGKYTDCNTSAEKLLCGSKEQILGKNLVMLSPETQPDGRSSHDLFEQKLTLALSGEHQRFEWRHNTLTGLVFDAEVSLTRILIDGIVAVQAIVRDITETKKAQEALRQSEKNYRTLSEASPNAIYIVEKDATVAYANTYMLNFLKKPLSDVKGKKLRDLLPMEDAEKQIQIIYNVFQHGTDIRRDDKLILDDGTEKWLSSMYTPLKADSGIVTAVLCVSYDITERKEMENQIATSLREKEFLLKEIHHRVKNNLQVISSLLSMQADKATDPKVVASLHDSQNRVKSIALVHEKLYQSKSLDQIEYGDYLKKIVTHLFDTYNVNPALVSCKIHAENIFVDINQAVPCSLIINEMLTNSLKYAFPGGRKGEITIEFSSNTKNYILIYHDDGIGIPEGITFERSESLGMKLIYGLTQQLSGTVILQRVEGTTFMITFPCIPKSGE